MAFVCSFKLGESNIDIGEQRDVNRECTLQVSTFHDLGVATVQHVYIFSCRCADRMLIPPKVDCADCFTINCPLSTYTCIYQGLFQTQFYSPDASRV